MEVEHVYDTGLEYPDPRFVVVIDDGQGIDNRILLQMSEDPYAKRGLFWRIEQFVPDIAYANLGTAVSLNELPVPCQQAVVEVLNEG